LFFNAKGKAVVRERLYKASRRPQISLAQLAKPVNVILKAGLPNSAW